MKRLTMAVVGVGHLGKEHARILSKFPEVDLCGVVDVSPAQAARIAELYSTRALTDYRDLLGRVDAVTVVVPTVGHHETAKAFLEAGCAVLVEKPIAATVAEADELVRIAADRSLPFQVGHIERFNPAYEEFLTRRCRPRYIRAERCGPFTGRSIDVGVILDLMIHDIDLMLATVESRVRRVEAFGVSVVSGHEDSVQARLTFENGCIADIAASRVESAPRRRMQVWSSEGYAEIDLMNRTLARTAPTAAMRSGGLREVVADPVRRAMLKETLHTDWMRTTKTACERTDDQLTRELRDFVGCVRDGHKPRVDGVAGRDALEVAYRVLESVRSHQWEGGPDGAIGAQDLPEPVAVWFDESTDGRSAA